jgi:hypothetical protein
MSPALSASLKWKRWETTSLQHSATAFFHSFPHCL